jgi:hypothetical protein
MTKFPKRTISGRTVTPDDDPEPPKIVTIVKQYDSEKRTYHWQGKGCYMRTEYSVGDVVYSFLTESKDKHALDKMIMHPSAVIEYFAIRP